MEHSIASEKDRQVSEGEWACGVSIFLPSYQSLPGDLDLTRHILVCVVRRERRKSGQTQGAVCFPGLRQEVIRLYRPEYKE